MPVQVAISDETFQRHAQNAAHPACGLQLDPQGVGQRIIIGASKHALTTSCQLFAERFISWKLQFPESRTMFCTKTARVPFFSRRRGSFKWKVHKEYCRSFARRKLPFVISSLPIGLLQANCRSFGVLWDTCLEILQPRHCKVPCSRCFGTKSWELLEFRNQTK